MSEPHSAAFLNDTRDDWWNGDFLRLCATRFGLAEVRSALDVGAGQGHWTRIVARLLHPEAQILGVEREPRWVEQANAHQTAGQHFVVGTAEALPVPSASVDLVTCQTLLIHLPNPSAALREFHRVLRPGGRLLCAEPNNLVGCVAWTAAVPEANPERVVEAFRLEVRVERGKRALGEGYNSIGEGLLAELASDFEDVAVVVNDRAGAMRPPYPPSALREARGSVERGDVGWSPAEAERYYLAGGGTPEAFAQDWAAALELGRLRLAAMEAGTYQAAEGSLHYLFSARKPVG